MAVLRKIRIGTDITLGITVMASGHAVDWESQDIKHVYAFSDVQGQPVAEMSYEQRGSTLRCVFNAEDQNYVGAYRVIIEFNDGSAFSSTLDMPAFELVRTSEEADIDTGEIVLDIDGAMRFYSLAEVISKLEGLHAEVKAAASAAREASGNANAAATKANDAAALANSNASKAEASNKVINDNERKRIAQETARESAEADRQRAELERQKGDESIANKEAERERNEEVRETNEQTREDNELERRNAESARNRAEAQRASRETKRISNETSRQAAENKRVAAETSRQEAETARVNAEAGRVTEFARLKKESEEATKAASEVSDVVAQHTEKITKIEQLIGEGYAFMGVATPETNPSTPDQKVFYIANGKGTYANFGGINVDEDEVVLLAFDNSWEKLLSGINYKLPYPYVEMGGIDEYTGKNIPNPKRARSGYIARMDIRNFICTPLPNIQIWVFFYDSSRKKIGETLDWISVNNQNDLRLIELNDNITYLRFIFKKISGTEITETDLANIKESFRQQFVVSSLYDLTDANFVNSNNSKKGIFIKGNTIRLINDGFQLVAPNGYTYYVGYKAGEDEQQEYEYDGSGALSGSGKAFLYLDTSVLIRGKRVAISKALITTTSPLPRGRYVLMAAWVMSPVGILLCQTGLLGMTIAFEKASETTPDSLALQQINNDILFSPDFYAYQFGKELNSDNVGVKWLKRFTLGHISDTHGYVALMQQAGQVTSAKMDIMINTGDDANGMTADDANIVLEGLNNACNAIKNNVTIPYLVTPGNHDVPGITHEQYFNIAGVAMENLSHNIVWGDKSGGKTYGYLDCNSGSESFRIIMLYPYDYSDGQFNNPYQFQSAVFSQKQIDWLVDTLLDAGAKNLNVITMMHYSFGDDSLTFNEIEAKPDAIFYQDAYMIPDIIDAIQNKIVLQKTYNDNAGINNINIDRDFSSAPDLKFVVHLFGHIHSKNWYRCQKHNGKKYKLLMVGETSLGANGTALNKSYKIPNTINEIAFSALSIDTREKAIYRISYGAYKHYDVTNTQRVEKITYNFD